ncbi:MAG: TetR/AcrR family transcriptional regulator [bacterium]
MIEKPSSSSPPSDMRHRILIAAAKLLAMNGYQATTLRAIAQEAGIKAGSIYYHFPSKEHISTEILNLGVALVAERIKTRVTSLARNADGTAILRAAIAGHLEALFEHLSFTRAAIRCYSTVPEEVRQQTRQARLELDSLWIDVLKYVDQRGGLPPYTDIKALHNIIIGALNWTIEWQGAKQKDRQALTDQLMTLISPHP